ncbi:dinitrogenase iron-molybdenum cofactor [bacterium BMS3Bbin12]|nr:dinitrogenase iron-molybdenum cofactor [bacterium BMS3Abin12]GBE47382.1 dinitrogenase iron-molybdenum cofactor [bacterium BMS3Bbin12]GBE49600.1 dinitrogenase iron-molybdenum cofactor [bacterium BMS3Bbin13]
MPKVSQIPAREPALRIALAARVLPGVDVRRLLQVLDDRVGAPLTAEKLAAVTVTRLKGGLAGEEDGEGSGIGMEHLEQAVRCLRGEEAGAPDRPPAVRPYRDGDMPGSIRVAVASNGAEALDGHYGSCSRFLIYQVGPGEVRLIDIRSTDGADRAEDKNTFRAGLIGDCHVAYLQSIGGPAAARVVRAGVLPLKVPEGGNAPEVLAQLQAVMAGSPPPWLAKIVGVPARQRVRFTVEAGG